MAELSVLPPSNLPARSIPWARRLENSIQATSRGAGVLIGSTESENRTQASNTGALGGQISDVQSRTVVYSKLDLATVSRTTPALYTSYQYSGFVNIPFASSPDGAVRKCLLAVSASAYNSTPSGIMDGKIAYSVSSPQMPITVVSPDFGNPDNFSTPGNWKGSKTIFGEINTSGGQVRLDFFGWVSRVFDPPVTVNVGLENINLIAIYGEKI